MQFDAVRPFRSVQVRRLLQFCSKQQAAGSKPVVRLETNAALEEAMTLYRSSGYTEVAAFNNEAYAHHWFEKQLTPAPVTAGEGASS